MKQLTVHVIKTGMVLVFLASIMFLPGCDDTKITTTPEINPSIIELSLLDLWDAITDSTDIQEPSAQMDMFNLRCDKDGRLEHLYFTFYGRNSKGILYAYIADLGGKNRIHIRANEADNIVVKRHPAEVFREIDKLGLDSLETGDEGLSVMISFVWGDVGYGSTGVYQLENGKLKPIEEVIFHSKLQWCTIEVFHLVPNDSVVTENGRTTTQATTASAPISRGTSSSQIWLLSDDINRLAETVIYPGESPVNE
ncbi:MAG: hypothetical protein A2158_02530 [Chloroflexi bacterium RBG_13_46_14]|nr:MAG: hypothetical protein A2158_02530 [Chloroflexi bacterium RBG_13_46_14]